MVMTWQLDEAAPSLECWSTGLLSIILYFVSKREEKHIVFRNNLHIIFSMLLYLSGGKWSQQDFLCCIHGGLGGKCPYWHLHDNLHIFSNSDLCVCFLLFDLFLFVSFWYRRENSIMTVLAGEHCFLSCPDRLVYTSFSTYHCTSSQTNNKHLSIHMTLTMPN